MLPPQWIDGAADDILELYSALDTRIIQSIAQRLARYGGITGASAWQAEMAQQSGLLYDDIITAVAAISDASDAQVRALFEDAGIVSVEFDRDIYTAAGLAAPPIRMSPRAMQILTAGFRKTNGTLHNLTITTALEAQQSYIRAATAAEMMVESGAFDLNASVRTAIKEAAADGAFVQYPSSRRDRLDVAVRRAVLTGVNQTCAEISLGYADDLGCDLVEVTSHHGARPEHALWQGKIFSRSGKSKEYADFVSATGYGTGDGLCGWNCRHSFYPYFEGLSASAYPRKTVDTQLYIYTQMQRAMERKIRATKRELIAIEAAEKAGINDAELDFEHASAKLARQTEKMRQFVQDKGLQQDKSRTQTLGFGHSTAGKAVQAWRKSAAKSAK